jgi:predicted aspartyl protease
MGTFSVAVTIVNPLDPTRHVTLECLVDTGATYSIIPAPLLEQLGIRLLREDTFTVATGEQRTWTMGGVQLQVNGRTGWSMAVFGPVETPPVLGAHGLEALGLGVDPVRRRLIPITPLAL